MANRISRSTARSSGRRARVRRHGAVSSPRKRIKTFFAIVALGFVTCVALGLIAFLVVFWRFSAELPGIEAVTAEIHGPVPTTVYSDDGVLLARLDVVNQQPVSLEQIPKNLIDATVAIEDHRFWEHPGIDIQGIGRAIVANLRGSGLRQGASTLTQQFVRQPEVSRSLNPNGPQDNRFGLSGDKKYSRKIREALIALRIEQIYSKKEILRLYLNNVYYGSGAYGVQAAAQTYFGKSADQLTLPEAALMAGLPQRPSRFSPFDHLKSALRRRDEVLNAMETYQYISPSACAEAKLDEPKLAQQPDHKLQVFKAPYFTSYILEQIRRKYGPDYLYSGLKIETTLNYKMQGMAEAALEQGIKNANNGANQGAVVSIDNKSGYIRALVGGRNYRASRFNAVTQGRRQPGSAFKAFVYSAAFDTDTFKLDDSLSDTYFAYPGDPKHRGVKGETNRTLDLVTAIAKSSNSVAVQVAYKVGIRTVIQYAHKMGITTKLDPYLPTAIGASAVRPLDICSAYSIFPMNGSRAHPMSVVRITDADGNVIEENTPDLDTNILKQSTIDQMNRAFEAVVQSGTGVAARGTEQTGIIENARGKTGTTNDSRDVWFVGYTPELTTAIWVANTKVIGKKQKRYVYREMPGAFGGTVCAPIWHDFMIKAIPEERKFRLLVSDAAPNPPDDPALAAPDEKAPVHRPRRQRHTDESPAAAPAAGGAPAQDSGADTGPVPADSSGAPSATTPVDPLPGDRNTEPATGGQTDPAPPTAPPVRAPAPRAAEPDTVSVRICVDSGQLAGKWCPAVKSVRLTTREAGKLHRCTLHKPPPGESE